MNIVLVNSLNVDETIYKHIKDDLVALGHNFEYYLTKPESEKELYDRVKDADIIIDDNTKISGNIIKKCAKLRYIDVAFTGVDHIDLEACKEKNIVVSNASGYSTEAVSELVISYILGFLRNLIKFDSLTRSFKDKENILGEELKGKTVGVIGAGKIGSRVIGLLKAFEINLLVYNRSIKEDLVKEGIKFVSLQDLLKNSDIVTVHIPLNSETTNFIGEKEINLLKKDVIIINTSRGPVIDEKALYEALKNHKIQGACIDVYSKEPPLEKDNPLVSLDNVILTPHIGYFTKEAMIKRVNIAIDNLHSYLNGEIKNRII